MFSSALSLVLFDKVIIMTSSLFFKSQGRFAVTVVASWDLAISQLWSLHPEPRAKAGKSPGLLQDAGASTSLKHQSDSVAVFVAF